MHTCSRMRKPQNPNNTKQHTINIIYLQMVPARVAAGLVVVVAAPDLALRDLGIDQRRPGLARLLVDLVDRLLRAAPGIGRRLGASAPVGLGQFDAVERIVDGGGGRVELPRLDDVVVGTVGIASVVAVIVDIFIRFKLADEDRRVGEAADLGRGVVHAAEVLLRYEEGGACTYGKQGYNMYMLDSNHKLTFQDKINMTQQNLGGDDRGRGDLSSFILLLYLPGRHSGRGGRSGHRRPCRDGRGGSGRSRSA